MVWIYLLLGAGFLHVTDVGPLGIVMRWWGGVRMVYQLSPVQFGDSEGKKNATNGDSKQILCCWADGPSHNKEMAKYK